jgi:predicted HTH domain antitoxin
VSFSLPKEGVVLGLFQEGEISSGKAAEILGLSKAQFLELLSQQNLPYLDADLTDLEREVAAAESAGKTFST